MAEGGDRNRKEKEIGIRKQRGDRNKETGAEKEKEIG